MGAFSNRKALLNDCCRETTNHGFALLVWQHHVLVAFYIRDFLRSHARCFWFLQNATGYSFKHLWISRAYNLLSRRLACRSHFTTQAHILRASNNSGGRVCLFNHTIFRDLCPVIRPLGRNNIVHFLVGIDQSDSQFGIGKGTRPRIRHSRRW